jgi:protein-disulfide isomerase
MAAAAVGAVALAGCSRPAAETDPAAMSMGDPNAKVHVEEYASTTCSHCGRFNNEVFPAFKARYIDTGKVRYTLHEFLTPPQGVAAAGFLTARCAGPEKYFEVIDTLFKGQAEMYAKGDASDLLHKAAEVGGLSEEQFNACISDEAARNALVARVQKAIDERHVNATPTFFINGKKVKEGEMSLAELDAAVAEASR